MKNANKMSLGQKPPRNKPPNKSLPPRTNFESDYKIQRKFYIQRHRKNIYMTQKILTYTFEVFLSGRLLFGWLLSGGLLSGWLFSGGKSSSHAKYWCCEFKSQSGRDIQHYVINLSVTCDGSMVFSGSSGFPHQ